MVLQRAMLTGRNDFLHLSAWQRLTEHMFHTYAAFSSPRHVQGVYTSLCSILLHNQLQVSLQLRTSLLYQLVQFLLVSGSDAAEPGCTFHQTSSRYATSRCKHWRLIASLKSRVSCVLSCRCSCVAFPVYSDLQLNSKILVFLHYLNLISKDVNSVLFTSISSKYHN